MMWHTRSVTVLVEMCCSYLVKELQTRESDGAGRNTLSVSEMPVRAPRNTTITCGTRGHSSACGGERHVVYAVEERRCCLVRVVPAGSSKAAQADHLEHAHEQKKVAKCRDVREHTYACVGVEHVDRERRAATRFVHHLQGSPRGPVCGDTHSCTG